MMMTGSAAHHLFPPWKDQERVGKSICFASMTPLKIEMGRGVYFIIFFNFRPLSASFGLFRKNPSKCSFPWFSFISPSDNTARPLHKTFQNIWKMFATRWHHELNQMWQQIGRWNHKSVEKYY